MCGIAGILTFSNGMGGVSSPVEESILVRMRDQMLHRGPDAGGVWISPDRSVGLAHRRLSIIDLSPAANQPMVSHCGRYMISFNGEIYNYREIRAELGNGRGKGEDGGQNENPPPSVIRHLSSVILPWRGHSDTEVMLEAIAQWGVEKAIQEMDGMFAIALWDSRERRLWLARDRMGKKPIYFAFLGNQLVFASEIKAILVHPAVSRRVSEEALWHYLTLAATPAPLTLFDGIFKLPPATTLTIRQEKGPNGLTFTEYWRPWGKTDDPPRTLDEYAREVRDALQKSVERRLMSDVPFGVFLSGGVDSSANVALMSKLMNRPVDTFSVGFADDAQKPYNEIPFARQVAGLFKTNHHEILISDKHFFDFADRLAFQQDEPLSDPVCFPLYYVSQLARQNGTIVIQVGEGSDELFAGYDLYQNYFRRQNQYWGPFQNLPRWMQKTLAGLGDAFLSPRQAVHLKRAAAGEPILVSAALAFYDSEKKGLRNWPALSPSAGLCAEAYDGENPSMSLLKRIFPNAKVDSLPSIPNSQFSIPNSDWLKRVIWWECHQRLGELLLMRLDKMSMAHSVEGRAPFLDTNLVQLAMRIPSSMKIEGGIGKAVLKKAVEPLLPKELIYRKKVGFCGGSGNMLTPAILKFAGEKILSILPKHDWPVQPLERILANHRNGSAENSFQIWNLMNLALWFRQWME